MHGHSGQNDQPVDRWRRRSMHRLHRHSFGYPSTCLPAQPTCSRSPCSPDRVLTGRCRRDRRCNAPQFCGCGCAACNLWRWLLCLFCADGCHDRLFSPAANLFCTQAHVNTKAVHSSRLMHSHTVTQLQGAKTATATCPGVQRHSQRNTRLDRRLQRSEQIVDRLILKGDARAEVKNRARAADHD